MMERIKSRDKLDLEKNRMKKTIQTKVVANKIIVSFKVTKNLNKVEVGE